MPFAENTSVPVRKTRMEIEDLLEKWKARAFYTAQDEGRAVVGFVLENLRIQFTLTLPRREDFAKRKNRSGWLEAVSDAKQNEAWEQACRTQWRALLLALKAKFVSVDAGVENTEEAFLAHVVLENKQTVHQWFRAQLEKSEAPGLLQLGSGG